MLPRILLLLFLFQSVVLGEKPAERSRLYKKADPANSGGLQGTVSQPAGPIEQILAINTEDVEQVFEGVIGGPKRTQFQFTGLPTGKYDLMVTYASEFYEGLKLNSEPSTLTPDDQSKIDVSIQRSEPFFLQKTVHRLEGTTGRGQNARAICTFLRKGDKESSGVSAEGHGSFRRTFKLVLFKDVGPGWQITRARDLYPVWVKREAAAPKHHFSAALSQKRVADQLKDLGSLDLSK